MRSRTLALAIALFLAPASAFAQPAQTQGNAVGDLLSPCSSNVPIFGTGSGLVLSCSGVVQVAHGGTGGSSASGTLLDNITGFSSTGFLERTGAGTYSFIASPLPIADGGTNAATAANAFVNLAPVPTRAGDVLYWNGSAWTTLAGNNSSTQVLSENSSGVPAWLTPSGTGTVTSATIATAGGLTNTGTCTITTSGTCTLYAPGGFLNKFRNGTFDIWQRGTSALATSTSSPGSYTADGWQVQQAGAAGTCSQDTGNNGTKWSIKCVGIASNTGTIFRQPIESNVAYPLAGQTITVQFQFKQDTGSGVTPHLSTCFASASDNFATCTGDLASTGLTSCVSGSWCTESYTLSASASATNGYRIEVDCNTALTSAQHCWITAADVRVTPGVSTGVNANPPPPELRPVANELVFCQRYLNVLTATSVNFTVGTGVAISGTRMDALISFGMMRAAPNVTYPAAAEMRFVIAGTPTTGTGVGTNAVTLSFLDVNVTVSSATAGQAGIAQLASVNDQIILGSEL